MGNVLGIGLIDEDPSVVTVAEPAADAGAAAAADTPSSGSGAPSRKDAEKHRRAMQADGNRREPEARPGEWLQMPETGFSSGTPQVGGSQRPGAESSFGADRGPSLSVMQPGGGGQGGRVSLAAVSWDNSEQLRKIGTRRGGDFAGTGDLEKLREVSDGVMQYMVNEGLSAEHGQGLYDFINHNEKASRSPQGQIQQIDEFLGTLPGGEASVARAKMRRKHKDLQIEVFGDHGARGPGGPNSNSARFQPHDVGFSAGMQRGRSSEEMHQGEEQVFAAYGEKLWAHTDELEDTLRSRAVPRDTTPAPRSQLGLAHGVGQTCFDDTAPCAETGHNIFISRPLLS